MEKPSRSERKRTRILIVDDDASIRIGLSQILVSEGFEVNTAADADRVCDVVESVDPDLILLDLVLPGVNGFDAIDTLKSHDGTAAIPVIAMTASWLGSQFERLESLGFSAALRKPFSGSTLCRKIREVQGALSARTKNAARPGSQRTTSSPPEPPYRRA